MNTLFNQIKEAIEKEQHVCKSHTYRYISNIPKRDNTFFQKPLCGLVFVDKTTSCIFFKQRKMISYKTAIKILD